MTGLLRWPMILALGALLGASATFEIGDASPVVSAGPVTAVASPEYANVEAPTGRAGPSDGNSIEAVPPASSMVSLVPARLLESRQDAPPTVDGQFSGLGIRPAGSVTELVVAGRGGVAADASAVVLNVTVTESQGSGFVTVWPCGSSMPNASNLNFQTGWTIPNAVIAKVGVGGKVCLFTMAKAHLIADVSGYFVTPAPGIETVKSEVSVALVAHALVISYEITVKNTGNVTLTAVTIVDPKASTGPTFVSANLGSANGTLVSGEVATYTATHTLTQLEIDSGSFTNTATGAGIPVTCVTGAPCAAINDSGVAVTTVPSLLHQPSPIGSTGTARSELVIRNDTSRELHVTLTGPETRVATLPASPTSSDYFFPPFSCRTGVPSITLDLAPGLYDVTFSSGTLDPFLGTWALDSGDRYGACIYILRTF